MKIKNLVNEAHAAAAHALRHSPIEAVQHLKDVCLRGGLMGKRYDSCFYGTLTKGTGVNFEDMTDHEVWTKVVEFGQSIHVTIRPNGPHDAIEKFVLNIHGRHTAQTCGELALIVSWCDDEIFAREHGRASDLERGLRSIQTPLKDDVNETGIEGEVLLGV